MGKRDLIIDSMEQLMKSEQASSISVSDIARNAGIGKGSIYYYFKSKEDILEAVIERSYSKGIEKGKELVLSTQMDALSKMEIIFRTCRESSMEKLRQDTDNYFDLQQNALLHQQYIQVMIRNLKPILADIIRQGVDEGSIVCEAPEDAAEISLILLTTKLDNHITHSEKDEIEQTLGTFASMLEVSFHITPGRLNYLREL